MIKLSYNTVIDDSRLFIVAGPCVLESDEINEEIIVRLVRSCRHLSLPFIFKASFDKANRTSHKSERGPGIEEGLKKLKEIKEKFKIPILTDVHETWQCAKVAEVADIIQIPAFLCRQTDLLKAAVETGKVVNVKKGQFLAPWDMQNVVNKMKAFGVEDNLILTERGSSFGYNTLVNDMRAIPIMQATKCPVMFDATHSVQIPGGKGTSSGGQREYVPLLAQCAVTAGCDGIFMETHPDPDNAKSDGPNSIKLSEIDNLIISLNTLHLYKRWRKKEGK